MLGMIVSDGATPEDAFDTAVIRLSAPLPSTPTRSSVRYWWGLPPIATFAAALATPEIGAMGVMRVESRTSGRYSFLTAAILPAMTEVQTKVALMYFLRVQWTHCA